MTRADHVSGSDRIYEALEALDPERRIGIVVNVQGDLPTIDPADIRAALDAAVRSRRRYRDARRGDHRSSRTHQSECGQGDWPARRVRPLSRHHLYPRQRHRPRAALSPHRALRLSARGAASASSSCRRRPTSSARSSSNCARSMPACASMSPWSKACRSASTRRRNWRKRAKCSPVELAPEGLRQTIGEEAPGDGQEKDHFPGRTGGEFASRLPRSLSGPRAGALPDLRGLLHARSPAAMSILA